MAKKFYGIFFLGLCISLHVQAIIFESDRLDHIVEHVDKDTLVVFDIDNTIIETTQYLGSDVWLCHEIDMFVAKGFSFNDALNYILPLYYLVHMYHDMKPIQNAPQLIKSLQAQGIPVIALTNRSDPMVITTFKQFDNMGIDFSLTSIYDKKSELKHTHRGQYDQGVVFCGTNSKGKMLFLLLEKAAYMPKKILFIDDKLKYVKSVEKEVEAHGIAFTGIRFSGADETKAGFSAEIADQQLVAFNRWLGSEPL